MYKDTIETEFTLTTTFAELIYGNRTLLPSLSSSATPSRSYVMDKVILEVLPTSNTDQANIQLQAPGLTIETGTVLPDVPMSPFKLTSAVNPTMYVLDYRKLGKICPFILRPFTHNNSFNALKVVGKAQDDTTTIYGRITTFIRLFPQDGLIRGTPAVLRPLSDVPHESTDPHTDPITS